MYETDIDKHMYKHEFTYFLIGWDLAHPYIENGSRAHSLDFQALNNA